MPNKIRCSVPEAAQLLDCTEQFLRVSLQRGLFDFGTAVKMNGNRYTYYISYPKLMDYLGR